MKMYKLLLFFSILISTELFGQTANDFSSYRPYTASYAFGMNPGWYSNLWSTQQVMDLGMGNPDRGIKGLGAHSFRMQLYNAPLETFGYDIFVPDYKYLEARGIKDLACMIGGVSDANRWNPFDQHTEWNGKKYDAGQMWKGMYEPVWLNAEKTKINPANTYAVYLYKTVQTYGRYIKFWEVINEPDFSYSNGGWLADVDPNNKTTWFYVDPKPEELVNIRVTVPYYIRLLRISWEVIKKLSPDSYVCTGGLGNRSFLAALLRNTDNPVDGSITKEYPLKAGAYFDVCSFHDYPEFSPLLKTWDNAKGKVVYFRHSDNMVAGHLLIKKWMDSLLRQDGYDGKRKPVKHFICTETGCSRDNSAEGFGGNLQQLNYNIKCQVKTLIDGQIKQMYWYATGDYKGSGHWDKFGCYYWFGDNQPYDAKIADQGIAQKTLSDLIYGKQYDAAKTRSLNIPAGADGGAFKDSNGRYVFVLWAKTTTDMTEEATASITLPQCVRKEWNFSQTGQSKKVSGQIALNATPSFFEPLNTSPIGK
jgi:hypothetical protein